MRDIQSNPDKLAPGNLVNYTVLEIIHHIMGNGLAVISGYTQLLLRSMAVQEKNISQLDPEILSSNNEKSLTYLQIMRESEEYLNHFLAELRKCSLEQVKSGFGQCLVKTDIVSLSTRIIEKLAPLYKDGTLQIQLPSQPFYVLCNPLWMKFALEHVLNHTIAAHKNSTPVVIKIGQFKDCCDSFNQAKIEIHLVKEQMKQKIKGGELFDLWSQTLDERDQNVCVALCMGIFYEHGGRIWIEQDEKQETIICASLPMM